MRDISADRVCEIIKNNVNKYRDDIDKLNDVSDLLPRGVTDPKKDELINIVFALQAVHHEVLNLVEETMKSEFLLAEQDKC